jgi:hypothetical protein
VPVRRSTDEAREALRLPKGLKSEQHKQHLFLAKCLDILQIENNVTQIVTGVNFTVAESTGY